MSDHGVAARFPFLDENVVSYLSSLDTEIKCNLNLPRGIGEKLVLRLAAHKLGLVKTARKPRNCQDFKTHFQNILTRHFLLLFGDFILPGMNFFLIFIDRKKIEKACGVVTF